MTTSKTYTAIYEHDADEDAWDVRIKGVAGCQTYGRSLRQAQSRIREALALWLDVTPAEVGIRDQFPGALGAVAEDVSHVPGPRPSGPARRLSSRRSRP